VELLAVESGELRVESGDCKEMMQARRVR